jgi:hypothetical protein
MADVAWQYHCAGSSQLASEPNLDSLKKVLALPSTTNLQSLARTRICEWLTDSLRLGNNPSSATLMEPLLHDMVEVESVGSFSTHADAGPSFILALHLGGQRALLWQTNLGKILGSSAEEFTSEGFKGQKWKGADSFWIIPARDWLLAGHGHDFSRLQSDYLGQIKAKGRPILALDQNWLEVNIDSSHLGGLFQYLQPANIRVSVRPNEANLKIEAQVVEKEAIPWQADAWKIPRDLVRGEVISFTAARDIGAFLKMGPEWARLDSNPLTNQFCFWALDRVPMADYMAWPVTNASNALAQLTTEAPAVLNPDLKRFNGTELTWLPQLNKLLWMNMQMFRAALEAVQEDDGQFLFLSSFPRSPKSKPVPEALLSQIEGRTNLVYYDWELTGKRLQELQILAKMISNRSLGQGKDAMYNESVEREWLIPVAGLAGNTVTEITRIAPNELLLTRKAPIGLTSLELVLLADWICDANTGPINPKATGKGMPFPAPPAK